MSAKAKVVEPLCRFNSNPDGNIQCQLLKLSEVHTGCRKRKELKQVEGVSEEFEVYSMFEPGLYEPTLRPYTDEKNNEDYFMLRMLYLASLQEGSKARIDGSFRYSNIIGMTLYNENMSEIVESMRGVLLKGGTADLDLKSTLVVIVVDGCDMLNQADLEKKNLREVLKALGLYDEEKVRGMRKHWDSGEKPSEEVCFVFESDLMLEEDDLARPGLVGKRCWQNYKHAESKLKRYSSQEDEEAQHVRTLFVVKPYNEGKLHSHLWLMFGFCIFLNPTLLFVSSRQLVDIGTEATPGSLAALESYMSKHPSAGGCCGEIIVKDWCPKKADWVDSITLMAQWFEYKMGHVLNKTLEDIMGYIGVLPGAFSCYRWDALAANNYQVLVQYFRFFIAPHTLSWKLSNIYHLAEDRVMSEEIIKLKHRQQIFEIVGENVQQVGKTKEKIGYTLGFVKAAKALTEGAPTVTILIAQRRRWINGGWFALVKMVLGGSTLSEIRQSGHSLFRKFWLLTELLYLFMVISFTWVAVGAFYLGFMMALEQSLLEWTSVPELFAVLRYVYLFHLIMVFVVSLSLKPDSCPMVWKYFVLYFAVVAWFLCLVMATTFIRGDFSILWIRYVVLSLLVILWLAACFYGEEYLKMAVSAPAYISLLPFYINVLAVFAICKTDDVSWGAQGGEVKNTEKSFSRLKTWYLLFYIVCNVAFGMGFENINQTSVAGGEWSEVATTTLFILYSVAMGVLVFPFLSLLIYLGIRTCRCYGKSNTEKQGLRQVVLRSSRKELIKKHPKYDLKPAFNDLLPKTLPGFPDLSMPRTHQMPRNSAEVEFKENSQ